ncbi:MAG: DUF2334 domain-containing protein [Peptostreptococcaceae bacterium]|jgi:uncharacterized protein YdaL|nr:DUF2334 domain-containing protein [Peptostreptococcaceae bacterium]
MKILKINIICMILISYNICFAQTNIILDTKEQNYEKYYNDFKYENTNFLKYKNKNILIFYNNRTYEGTKEDIIKTLDESLHHFNVKTKLIKISDFKNKKYKDMDLYSYSYIFIMDEIKDKYLLNKLKSYRNEIIYIGEGIYSYININKLFYEITSYNLGDYIYYNKSLEIKNFKEKYIIDSNIKNNLNNIMLYGFDFLKFKNLDEYFNIKEKINSNSETNLINNNYIMKNIKVYSFIKNDDSIYPYIYKIDNNYFISRFIPYDSLFGVFCDFNHKILKEEHDYNKKVFIRVEDVHMFRDLTKLKKLDAYLLEEDIPYMIALIPAYKNINTNYISDLSERKSFVNQIKNMQKNNAGIVLHGYLHSLDNEIVTGEGFEFFDGKKDRPLKVNMKNYAYKKIKKALYETTTNGIYPLAFEFPHYAASEDAYFEINKYFKSYTGQLQISDESFLTIDFPYIIYNSKTSNKLLPENLGFIEDGDKDFLQKLKKNYHKYSMVRDYMGGFFYHPYLNLKDFKSCIEFLKSQNLEFYNIKEDSNIVIFENLKIESKDNNIYVNGSIEYKKPLYKKILDIFNLYGYIILFVMFIVTLGIIFKLKEKKEN